jgi:hypothetical protein
MDRTYQLAGTESKPEIRNPTEGQRIHSDDDGRRIRQAETRSHGRNGSGATGAGRTSDFGERARARIGLRTASDLRSVLPGREVVDLFIRQDLKRAVHRFKLEPGYLVVEVLRQAIDLREQIVSVADDPLGG